MPPISKTKKIESLAKLLQRRFKGLPPPSERSVLEHLVYAALLENATFEQADSAYVVLESYFIDWNEIRVSTVRELADTFSMLPDPAAAGGRIRNALQGVFEKTYMFDLEEQRKKGKTLGQAVEFLREIPACTRFMIDYTAQVAFGGHFIPLDEASLRVFRLLGLAQVNKEGTAEEVPGLERAIAKKNGISFSTQLHHFAAGFFGEPLSTELRSTLKPVDPEALNRDWTPPILIIPKTAMKPAPQRPLPVVTLPFAPPDEDDFEEEAAGTEAEFLPDDSPFRPEEPKTSGRNDSETLPPMSRETESKETKKKPESVVAKLPPPPKQPEPKPSRTAKKIDQPALPAKQAVKPPSKQEGGKKPVVSIPVKKSESKKEPAKSKTPPPKQRPVKELPKTRKPKSPSPPAKKAVSPKSAAASKPKSSEKPTKSSTRKLREKKPK